MHRFNPGDKVIYHHSLYGNVHCIIEWGSPTETSPETFIYKLCGDIRDLLPYAMDYELSTLPIEDDVIVRI